MLPNRRRASRGRTTSRLLKNAAFGWIFPMLNGGDWVGERRWRRRGCRTRYNVGSFSSLQTESSRCCHQLRDSNQIVSSRRQNEEPLHQAATTMASLAQAADRLHPAEWLFDPLALDRAETVAGMPGGACVDCRTTIRIVLRDMRSAAELAAARQKVSGVT